MAARVLKKEPKTLEEAMRWAKEEVQLAEKLKPKVKTSRVAALATSDPFEPMMDTLQQQNATLEKMVAALQNPSAQETRPVEKMEQQLWVEGQIAALVDYWTRLVPESAKSRVTELAPLPASVAIQSRAQPSAKPQPDVPARQP